MSIECGICEQDLRGGHAQHCPRGKTVMSGPEPQTREEVEAFLRAKLDSGDAETGLYDLGLGYVVVDRCGPENKVSFQWFDEAIDFNRLIW